ncbi:MAG: RNA polymerase sigma factor [Phycisphaerales bacterium]|nr:RNA polymerase sigma factor [Phycisphaerales bacterium]
MRIAIRSGDRSRDGDRVFTGSEASTVRAANTGARHNAPVQDDWRTTSWILDQMVDGDDAAWRQFVERFREPLRRLARRTGLDDGEAEDAAQQTLLVFQDGLRRGTYDRDRGRLSAWLFGIARNEIRRASQRSRRRTALGLAGGEPWPSEAEAADAERDWHRDWQEQVLALAMARVRREVQPNTWAAFERVQLHGEEPATVAAALGISRNAVFVAKHRVLSRLRAIEAELTEVRREESRP